MTTLRPGVTEADTLAFVNAAQERHGLPRIARQTWYQSIRPLAEQDGAAWQSGATWLYEPMFIQEVAEYIAKRRVLVKRGEWKEKRSYSLEDMRNLVEVGVYDGEIDHPIFQQENT